jgi:hypothetical protein
MPILLRLPLHGGSRGGLKLQPVRRAARAIGGTLPLGHDAAMAASYGSKRFNETTQDAGPLPAFLTREKGKSLNVKRPWHLPNAAPLLRAALVAAFAVALCILLDWQFGLVGPGRAADLTRRSEKQRAGTHASCRAETATNIAAAFRIAAPQPIWRFCG